MPLYTKKPEGWKGFLSGLFTSAQEKKHALKLLNLTQFLGVINDNVFKFVMAFLLIHALGKEEASSILAATGAIYVIPFLLFSSSAGILADRFSKQKLLMILKGVEVLIMGAAIYAFSTHHIWTCYTLLFLLAAHSAMFGPSKYGIIPEIVPPGKVSKANSLVTSFTYLAIIIGTFLASFLTELTDRHFTWIAVFCLFVAIAGFISSLFIHHTPSAGSKKVPNFLFVSEIYHTLKQCRGSSHLLPAILGSSFFLFLGAFTQLNIIPFAIEALHFSEVAGGYLFLTTALGIALGSFLAGKFAKTKIDLAVPCFAGFGIVLCFLSLSIFSSSLIAVLLALIALGILGGIFIVPFDSFIQMYSETSKRGQTIAAANFLSFAGVLVASCSLYIFNRVFDLSPVGSFALMGILTFFANILLSLRLSSFSIPFCMRKFLFKFYHFTPSEKSLLNPEKTQLVILENSSFKNSLLVLGNFPHLHLLVPMNLSSWKAKLLKIVFSCSPISSQASLQEHVQEAKEHRHPCLCLQEIPSDLPIKSPTLFGFFKPHTELILLHIEKNASAQLTIKATKKIL